MNILLTEAELTGALTDLLAGLIIIPLFIILCKTATERKKEKHYWICLFATLDIAFLLGYTVHYHISDPTGQRFVWVFLYWFMLETTVLLLSLGISALTKGAMPDKRLAKRLHLAVIPLYLSVLIPEIVTGRRKIILCVVYCTVIVITGLVLMFFAAVKHGERSAAIPPLALIPLIPASLIQMKHNALLHVLFDFDHNGIAHLLITAAIFVLFAGAVKRLKN